MSLDPPTVYMPVVSPPTPAPSPGPSTPVFPQIASMSAPNFASLAPFQRRQFLSAILAECSPDDLLFISSNVSLRLRRDFLRELPVEIAIHILGFIDEPKSLLRAGRVSRAWHSLIADDVLWKRLCAVHKFDVEEQWEKESEGKPGKLNIPSSAESTLPSASKHRTRHSTGSVPSAANIPARRSYRQLFKLSYLNCTSLLYILHGLSTLLAC